MNKPVFNVGDTGLVPHPMLQDDLVPVVIEKVGKAMHLVRYFDREGELGEPKRRQITLFIPIAGDTDFGALVRYFTKLRRWHWDEQRALSQRYDHLMRIAANGDLTFFGELDDA